MGVKSLDSSVGIATGYGSTTEGSGFESLWRQKYCTLHAVQTGSGNHQASYPMGTGGKAVGGGGVKLTTHLELVPRLNTLGSIHPFPHTSSWRGA
jgi:hypothetical protein